MKNSKSIVIVGGAGLLGKSFVRFCKDLKYKVAIIDYCNDSHIEKESIFCDYFIKTDINNSKSLKKSIESIEKEFNKIDCVVNTSYPRTKKYGKAVFDIELEDFNQNLMLHAGGYFNVMQKFGKFFLKQGHGNIINIASIQGVSAPKFFHYEGTDMNSPIEYTAAKSSIISMSRYMAKFFAKKNIRVNCISPGGIYANQPKKFLEKYKSSCTSKGMLDPEDLKGALLFLISDNSKYVNGQNIIVDDGWSL